MLFIFNSASAQFFFEPTAGVDVSSLHLKHEMQDLEKSGSMLGYELGVDFKYLHAATGLYAKLGIAYHNLNANFDEQSFEGFSLSSGAYHMHYLHIPTAMVGYEYKLKSGDYGSFFAETGPYLGFAIAGEREEVNLGLVSNFEKINWGKADNEFSPIDYGMKFGIGYMSAVNVFIKVHYTLGLGNMYNLDHVNMVHRNWNFMLGYSLKL